jgi:peptide/nickel transport system substrate-binding protein
MAFFQQPIQAQPSGELRIGLPTLYDQTFHPIWETVYRKQYIEPMYDYLVGVDKEGNLDPKQGIATKWEVASNNLSWTFTIREGIKFHNGDPLTIEDVKYTIEQACSKKNLALARSDFAAKVSHVETIPPNKVIVHLKTPWPVFPIYLSTRSGTEGMIQPKKYIEEKGEKAFNKNPVGSGPYKFYEWKEGSYIKLVAQDSHWRIGVPKYKYLTFVLMPEEGTREAALRGEEVDIIAISLARVKKLKEAGFNIVQKKDGLHVGLMWIQDYRPEFPTNKKKVREALIYAINKDEIVKQILMGEGKVIGNATSMFTWSIEYKPYPLTPYDPKKAKRLLEEAGYPQGFTMYLYSFVTHLPETKLINEAIAGYWEAIGVKVKILEMDYNGFKPIWTKHQDPPGPAAFVLAWPNRPSYSWRNMYHSAALYSHKKDPQIDRLIEDFETKASMEEYITSAQKIMDYVLENFYSTGICTTHELFAANKKVPMWEMGKGVGSFRWEYIGEK